VGGFIFLAGCQSNYSGDFVHNFKSNYYYYYYYYYCW